MHAPNNIVFTAAQAIFDESMFPKCSASKMRPSTRLQTPAPPPMVCPDGKCDCQGPPIGDDEPLPSKTSGKRSFTRQEKGKAQDDGNSDTSSNPTTPSTVEAEPPTSVAPPQPPTRCSGRAHKVPKKEGNVYGDKHPVDQLPISAVLGSAPIPYRVYSAPTFGIPDWSAISRPVHVSCLPGSPDYFSILPAVYPTSCRPSTATWLNNPRLSPSGLRSTVYRLLSPFDLVLPQLWRQPIIATRDFLFRIDQFPRPPCLATCVVKSTFLFRSRLLLPD